MSSSYRAFFGSATKGLLLAVASFLVLGTVTALWPNPVFVRMTPAGGWEISLLAAQSGLSGCMLSFGVQSAPPSLLAPAACSTFSGWRAQFATRSSF